jgi:hypothetical protein
MKYYFLFICLFCSQITTGFGQGLTKDSIKTEKENLTLRIEKEYENFTTDTSNINILSVPVYFIQSSEHLFDVPNNLYTHLITDTSRYLGIIKKDDNIVSLIDSRMGFVTFTSEDDVKDFYTITDIRLILQAFKKAVDPFFINLGKINGETIYIVAYFDSNNTIRFIGRDEQTYIDFDTLVQSVFGSIEKYKELQDIAFQKQRLLLSISSMENAKRVIRRDYISFENVFPLDTMMVLKLFIDELDSLVSLTPFQKGLIKQKVLHQLKGMNNSSCYCADVSIYGEDITQILSSILPQDKMDKYLRLRSLQSWLVYQASNKIVLYLRVKGVKTEDINAAYNKLVFNSISK